MSERRPNVSDGAILIQHKNALLEVIRQSGIDPTRFSGEDCKLTKSGNLFQRTIRDFLGTVPFEADRLVFTIRLRGSPLFFSVTSNSDSFNKFWFKHNAFMPTYPEVSWQKVNDLEKLLRQFKEWIRFWVADYLKEEQTPDLWARLKDYEPLIDDEGITNEDISSFSREEKATVRLGIAQFRSSVLNNFDATQPQLEFIDNRLNYLSQAVDRLNHLDWRALAVSTVISIAVNLSADTERGRLLFHLFQEAFQSTLKLLQ